MMAYYNGIAPSVFSSIDQIGTDLLSNQGWLSHGLSRSVDSSILLKLDNGQIPTIVSFRSVSQNCMVV